MPDATPAQLNISGNIRLPDAGRLAEQLHDALMTRDVRVDLTGVETVDTAVLQVLLAARQHADLRGKTFEVVFAEMGAVAALVHALGLTDSFPDATAQAE